ncbi:MAG: 23S rRNA (guanosine(2251)-2'-O)-methyltransferase RlmB [Clostridia bacterium]|nr:23S rRNA (guanosine(2251)-2'-O)-methyltransferase RlmB [Clostridia bacterium]
MSHKIIGRNPVLEAIKAGRDIYKIFVKKVKPEGSLVPLLKKARDARIVISECDRTKLDELANGENHQGVVAFVSETQYKTIDEIIASANARGESPVVVICDRITDPHNLGAIIRTAECAGVHGVIIPKHSGAPVNEIVAKTSAGAVEYMNICRVTNLARTIDELKEKGFWITGAHMDGKPMYEIDFNGSVGIVVGSEGEGISRLVSEKCDFLASIPMTGKVTSLNASVAAGILMYEAVRQRTQK